MSKAHDLKRWDDLHANPPENWREEWEDRKIIARFDCDSDAVKYAKQKQYLYKGWLLVDLHVKDGYVVYEDNEYRLSEFHQKLKDMLKNSRYENEKVLPAHVLEDVLSLYESTFKRDQAIITIEDGLVKDVISNTNIEIVVFDHDKNDTDSKNIFGVSDEQKALVYTRLAEVEPEKIEGFESLIEKSRKGDI